MYYTIYRITNKINNKFYIGKHQTKDLNDGYMGSGKLLKCAMKKHGVENFSKEILFVFDNEKDMNDKEKEMVVISEQSYNLCEGGHGGFGFINRNRLHVGNYDIGRESAKGNARKKELRLTDKEWVNRTGLSMSKAKKGNMNWLGKNHTEETKQKIGIASKKLVGEKNSQYGSFWITNGILNKKCRGEIPHGYVKGRIRSLAQR